MQPVISVIVPAYKAEKYIEQTLSSIREQSYKGVIETVVVDDCSPDNTLIVCRDFAKKVPEDELRPIKILENDSNSGVAATRNRAVKESIGEYVCFLDSDDYWDKEKVEKQLDLIGRIAKEGKPEPILICTGRECVDENGKLLNKRMDVPEVITYKAMLKTNLIPCSSVMLKKEIALKYPMERDDLAEDYIDWMRIIKEYGPAYGINEPLLKYRMIQGSRSFNKVKAAKMHYGALRVLGFSAPAAGIHLISYAVNGVMKQRTRRGKKEQ